MSKINFLFPTPVMISNIDREFTREELFYIKNLKTRSSVGNTISVDTFVLEQEPVKNLREIIKTKTNLFFCETINPREEVKLNITQSWVNYTEKGQFHHHHNHSNSYISGVLYISASSETDKIEFYNRNLGVWHIPPKDYNIFNSPMWQIPVKTGDVVLFPSHLEHHVPPTEGANIRISLSFNTFLCGLLGSEQGLTKLIL